MTVGVHSEVGQLRQVIVHRPGLELARLTPQNISSLLFDDVMWARKAKEEHDVFTEVLREKGVRVHYFSQLLAPTCWRPPKAGPSCWTGCAPRRSSGPALVGPVRSLFEDLDGPGLAEYLVGGVLKADLSPLQASSLRWDTMRADDFVLPPLPNHLFPRDNSCWVYDGVSVNPMAKPARQRETVHMQAIYRYHPTFTTAGFVTYYGDDDASHLPASIEGGDVHVLGNRAVLIGMGERTTPMAVEILARALFRQRAGGPGDRRRAAAVARDDAPRHRDDHGRPEHVRAVPVLRHRACGRGP